MKKLLLILSAVLLLSGGALAQGLWLSSDMRVGQTSPVSVGQGVILQPMPSAISSSATISSGAVMQSGSRYSSQITGVGQTAPATYGQVMSKRREGEGGPPEDDDDYDPSNPQFGSLGDELLPLMLMAVLALLITVCRTLRRRYKLSEK